MTDLWALVRMRATVKWFCEMLLLLVMPPHTMLFGTARHKVDLWKSAATFLVRSSYTRARACFALREVVRAGQPDLFQVIECCELRDMQSFGLQK
jgi:hypothetical protein